MNLQKQITIDLNRPKKHTIHLGQADNTRQIRLTLLANGAPYDVAEDIGNATLTKHVKYIKANGVGGAYDWTSTDVAAVVATDDPSVWIVNLDEHATDVPGFAEIFVVFALASGEMLHSFPITLDVLKNVPENTDPGQPYYNIHTFYVKPVGGIPASDLAPDAIPQGLSDDIKTALLNIAAHVAWADDNGQDYYDALNLALNPPSDISSISAVYTQSGTVYSTDSLDSLRSDLVVTAEYAGGTSETVTAYTLSGDLSSATSTITVSYGGKTTTFEVTVTVVTVVADLDNDDFITATLNPTSGTTRATPYYYTATNRRCYYAYDIPVTGGHRFKVETVCNYNTAQVAFQFYNQTALTAVQSSQSYERANCYDTGWGDLTREFNVPTHVNGAEVKGVLVMLRQSDQDPDIASDFTATVKLSDIGEPTWTHLFTLADADISKKTGLLNASPYYKTDSTTKNRSCYWAFDKDITGGKILKFVATCNYDTANIAALPYTSGARTRVGNSQSITQNSDFIDSTWMPLTFSWFIPVKIASNNNTTIVGTRFNARQASDNPNIADDFSLSIAVYVEA